MMAFVPVLLPTTESGNESVVDNGFGRYIASLASPTGPKVVPSQSDIHFIRRTTHGCGVSEEVHDALHLGHSYAP